MKTRTKAIGLGAAALALGIVTYAYHARSEEARGFGPPFMHRGMMGPGMMGAGMHGPMVRMHGGRGVAQFDQSRIDSLRTELAITAAQEPAWTKYTKAIQDAATAMTTVRAGVDPATIGKMTPQDRFAFMTKMREQGQKQFDAVTTAADELLATLDDAQKAKAQDILPGLTFGPMHAAAMGGAPFRH